MVHPSKIAHNLGKILTKLIDLNNVQNLRAFITMPIERKNECILLHVRITPKSGDNKIIGLHDGMLKVLVTAVPEKGKANAALVKLIAKTLGIAKTSIHIVSGATARNKILSLPADSDLSSLKEYIPDI